MRPFETILLLASCTALISCTSNQKKFNQIQSEFETCIQQVKMNPSLKAISNKIALGGPDEQSLSMLTDSSYPTDEEKKAIKLYDEQRMACNTKFRSSRLSNNYPASMIAVEDSALDASRALLASLYEGKITYGEFAKGRKQVANSMSTDRARLETELRTNQANIDAQNQMLSNQRKAADAMMLNATKNPPPVFNNNNVNCTSRALGDQVVTNCN